jgi:hypothetical protein
MPSHRVIIFDPAGHILAAHVITAADNDAATERARQYVDGHDVEVWEQTREIANLRHDDK